ncbi:hypothetical protein [Microbacterium foliorum]|uniref:hypothetical protein n=1 Tax=Microbacterium foliorum TaxID=104336 RepID=UPI001D9FC673|nr:hypothetical protein [Microbacterium foliorum]CAH0146737.1 hypothetical protein SRABI44_00609 [Microbacterium foliorum]CAH0148231.1 hypothetical protein SRABI03_00692 [Microbacterium foliorum]
MRSPLATRLAASALAIVLLGGVAGCAADPGASEPVPTSTATSTPDPTPTTPATTAEPTPVPTASPSPEFGAFSFEQLAQICIDATVSSYAPDVVFDAPNTRIERRIVTPEWLVIVPAATMGYQGQSVCTIGGTPAEHQLELGSGSIEQLPEEQIQNLIRGENEGGDR